MKLFYHAAGTAGKAAVIVPTFRLDNGSAKSAAAFDVMTRDDSARGDGTLPDLVAAALARDDVTAVAIALNDDAVFDDELPGRLAAALERAAGLGRWAVLGATGLVRDGLPVSVIYAKNNPRINYVRERQPIIDCGADFFVVSADFLRAQADAIAAAAIPPESLPHWLVLAGYDAGRVSVFEPLLAMGIDGSEVARDHPAHAALIARAFSGRLRDAALPTLTGPVALAADGGTGGRAAAEARTGRSRLADLVGAAVQPLCEPLSLSIVTRTQFRRPHLIRRYLSTLTRARHPAVALEVVISTDIDRAGAEAQFAALQADFPALTLSLAVNDGRHGHSRVDNLLGGLFAARNDYVAFVDDDDYIHLDAFESLATLRFLGNRPLAIMATELRDEVWVETNSGRWVLESTAFSESYAPSRWHGMFMGYNHLPICAMVMPRDWARARVEGFPMRHDLSEDYTLFLLLLSAPDLPLIHELPETFCVVSLRDDGSNTVTMTDRSPWVRDITLFLNDLFIADPQAGIGAYQIQSAVSQQFARTFRPPPPAATAAPAAGRDIAVLKSEIDFLRAQIAAGRK